MYASSPAKRRVLGALDPNASPMGSTQTHQQKPKHAQQQLGRLQQLPAAISLTSDSEAGGRKRPVDTVPVPAPVQDDEPASKRVRVDEHSHSPRSHRSTSPDGSSVFDNSAIDTSQATNVTEPDVDYPAALPPRPFGSSRPAATRLTREEAREKAEILRLRLGLANYKVRTGQTDLPLEQLQVRRLPGARYAGAALPFSATARDVHEARTQATQLTASIRRPLPGAPARPALPPTMTTMVTSGRGAGLQPAPRIAERQERAARITVVDDDYEDDDEMEDANGQDALPRLPRPQQDAPANTPQRRRRDEEERLSSSALRGGAASGLLSLSRS